MIATFTDFGLEGPYLGQVHAVFGQAAAGIPVVDVFPDLPAFDVQAAAYLIPAYSQYLPNDSVCLCVVDPGVGSERAAIAVRADGRWYVGPDNSLLSIIIRRAAALETYLIDWQPSSMSDSFHGRDLFAPVCAMLANGETAVLKAIGQDELQLPAWPDDLDRIVFIDRYGNGISGRRAETIDPGALIKIGSQTCHYRRTFSEGAAGKPFWYCNANGLMEFAVPKSGADKILDLQLGQAFEIIAS